MENNNQLNSLHNSGELQTKDTNSYNPNPIFNFKKGHIQDDDKKLIEQGNEASISPNLKIILDIRESLKNLKASDIKFSEPVLMQGENAVIFPNTINVIQGQAGSHKSRLAENICAVFLKLNSCDNELLAFSRSGFNATHTVIYVDTERNLSEQLPYALQSIQIKAGYNKADHPLNFEYTSLLKINRKERFSALIEYLNYIRENTTNPLFIVLDISTDCIEDFNRVDKSLELIDHMIMAINEHNVIFLCIIHENPNSDKARGHFGTELMNKASTVMQVRFEKNASQNDTDIIRVKYLKCRSRARHASFNMKYSQEANGLVLADADDVSGVINSRKHKACNEDVIDLLENYLAYGATLSRVELLDKLCKDLEASQRTVENRIAEIINSEIEIFNEKGESCKLSKETKEKTVFYKLISNEIF